MTRILPLALCAALAAVTVILFLDNRSLRADLAARVAAQRASREAAAAREAEVDPGEPPGPRRGSGRGGGALLGVVGRLMQGGTVQPGPPPSADGPPPPAEPQTRRERQQKRIRDLLGRLPGETDEAYRARVAPLVGMALARPRARVEEQRHEFEAAAELSDQQRGELDRALADARAELVGLASKSITAGELTPYRRNTIGVLNFVGGAAGIADGFDGRLRQILGPEQLGLLDQTGFDIIEYLGLTTPWETVTPPPPAPNL